VVETMGDAQEIGMTYLETVIKAHKIAFAGRSLGGAAVGIAVLEHQFKEEVNYIVVPQMTFSRTTDICAVNAWKMTGSATIVRIVRWLVKWTGLEMDSVAVARKLRDLHIREIIIQGTERDEVMPLGARLAEFVEDIEVVTLDIEHMSNVALLQTAQKVREYFDTIY